MEWFLASTTHQAAIHPGGKKGGMEGIKGGRKEPGGGRRAEGGGRRRQLSTRTGTGKAPILETTKRVLKAGKGAPGRVDVRCEGAPG